MLKLDPYDKKKEVKVFKVFIIVHYLWLTTKGSYNI